MKKIPQLICIVLCMAALAGCSKNEPIKPANSGEEMVAIELSAMFEVEATRATYVSQAIRNVLFAIFDDAGTFESVKSISDYSAGERIYLRVGRVYKIFAIANLDNSNCPGGSVDNFFAGVSTVADLDNLFLFAPTTVTPGKMIMCSDAPARLDIVTGSPYFHTIPIRNIQTKIDLNIYNRVTDSGGGTLASGVTLHSYNINALPGFSHMLEQAADYSSPSSSADFWNTAVTIFPTGYTTEQLGSDWYRKYSIEIYTFENRQGVGTTTITNANQRKEYAPQFATEIVILGADAAGHVFNTFVHPGKGRNISGTTVVDDINNFDINRNCVYHINVVIYNTTNISSDTRRQYYKTVLCGELEDPGSGTGADF